MFCVLRLIPTRYGLCSKDGFHPSGPLVDSFLPISFPPINPPMHPSIYPSTYPSIHPPVQ